MRIEITYEFDEFQFSDGTYFATAGQADIVATVEPTYGEVEVYKVETIRLEKGRGEYAEIDDSHPLFAPISKAQTSCCGDHITEQIEAAAAEECGGFRSRDADMRADYQHAVGY